uniref:hypothetical protein n=1 Tax=Myxobolus honghuensis TaxID=1085956 RepID=UPI0030036B96
MKKYFSFNNDFSDLIVSEYFLGQMRGLDHKYFLNNFNKINEEDIVVLTSTTAVGNMGHPLVKFETSFINNKGVDLFTYYINRFNKNYEICLYNEITLIQDHSSQVSCLFFIFLDLDNKLCFTSIKCIIVEAYPNDFDLSIYKHVMNFRVNNFFKMFFFNYFLIIFFCYKNLYGFFITPNCYRFFVNPVSKIPVNFDCKLLGRDNRGLMCLSSFLDFSCSLDFYHFYFNNFYFSVNFFTCTNIFINKKVKYKFVLANRGGFCNFVGFKLFQFNFFSILSKLVYFFYGGFLKNDSFYSRFFISKFNSCDIFFNYGVIGLSRFDGYTRNIYKGEHGGRIFKYPKLDSSYHKDNAGKKEVKLKITTDSVFHYDLVEDIETDL